MQENLLVIYEEFSKICEKNKIKYFVAYGSLIGAVRHEGFIPWDDDFDVVMLRSEYDKFLSIFSKELEHNNSISLINYHTEPSFPHTFSRIGLKGTKAVQKAWQFGDFNMEIFIDVFPYDKVPSNNLKFNIQSFLIRRLMNLKKYKSGVHKTLELRPDNKSMLKKFLIKLVNNIPYKYGVIKIHTINRIQEKIQKWENSDHKDSEGLYSNFYTGKKDELVSSMCHYEDLNDLIYTKFHHLMVPIPKEYDKILTSVYGNYMKYPDPSKRTGNHQFIDLQYKELE